MAGETFACKFPLPGVGAVSGSLQGQGQGRLAVPGLSPGRGRTRPSCRAVARRASLRQPRGAEHQLPGTSLRWTLRPSLVLECTPRKGPCASTRSPSWCSAAQRDSDGESDAEGNTERERERELLRSLNLDPEDGEGEGEGGELREASDAAGESGADEAAVGKRPFGQRQGEAAQGEAVGLGAEGQMQIPDSSTEFLARVSSPEYHMRTRLEQTLSATAFDVVEANPWREADKPVFVLAREDEQLFTMRTRRPRREVEYELDLLFFRGRGTRDRDGSRQAPSSGAKSAAPSAGSGAASSVSPGGLGRVGDMPTGAQARRAAGSSRVARSRAFRVHVEDIREGILVFEDEAEATRYCRVLDDDAGTGSECMGVAQFQARDLFKVCEKSKALAVIFKKGSMPPSPEFLRHTLKARKQSLEDLE